MLDTIASHDDSLNKRPAGGAVKQRKLLADCGSMAPLSRHVVRFIEAWASVYSAQMTGERDIAKV